MIPPRLGGAGLYQQHLLLMLVNEVCFVDKGYRAVWPWRISPFTVQACQIVSLLGGNGAEEIMRAL